MKKVLIHMGTGFVVVMLAVVILFGIIRLIRGQQLKIRTENGIDKEYFVEIGGIEQKLQIRGENLNNPMVLFLHGGPGSPVSYVTSYMSKGLTDDYTFVHWDQRGCGETYYKNAQPQADIDLLLSDLDELVDYLRNTYHQEKIVIMGHSWGTVLGTRYVKEHSEKVAYYIGLGQVIDINRGEAAAAKEAIKRAGEAGNREHITQIEALTEEYVNRASYQDINWEHFDKMRSLTGKYLAPKEGMGFPKMAWIALTDPAMNFKQARWYFVSMDNEKLSEKERKLREYLFQEFSLEKLGYDYQVPMYFIAGDADWLTPYPLVQDYFEKVNAPQKQLFMIPGAGHATYMDRQETFAQAMESIRKIEQNSTEK